MDNLRIQQIKILLIRTSSIGDIIFCMPFVLALKKTFPKSEVTWLVDTRFVEIVKADQFVDFVIEWPKSEWINLFKSMKYYSFFYKLYSFIKSLRKVKYDLVIDLQGLLRTNLFTRFCLSTKSISLGSELCGSLFSDEVFSRDHKSRRISSEYLALAKHLNLNCEFFLPRFQISSDTEKAIFNRFEFLSKDNYFVIAPFTTRPEKHWLNLHWNELVAALVYKYKKKCVVLGRIDNKDQDSLIKLLEKNTTILVGQTNIMEAAGIIKSSSFLIGVDTGLTHMSVSLNKPTVALFGQTCPYLDPVNKLSKVIWLNLLCKSCDKHTFNKGNFSCLNGIHPDTVIKELCHITKIA